MTERIPFSAVVAGVVTSVYALMLNLAMYGFVNVEPAGGRLAAASASLLASATFGAPFERIDGEAKLAVEPGELSSASGSAARARTSDLLDTGRHRWRRCNPR